MVKLFAVICIFVLYCYGCASVQKTVVNPRCAELEATLESAMAKFIAYFDVDKSIISDRKCTKQGLEFTWRVEGESNTENQYVIIVTRMLVYYRPDGSPDVVKLHDILEKRDPLAQDPNTFEL